MEPDSKILVVLLVLGSGALVYGAIRFRHLAIKIVCGLFAVGLAMVGGMAVVNDSFGYYRSWSALNADLTGSYASFGHAPAHAKIGGYPELNGKIQTVDFKGSGIDRQGIVYLPPQYSQPAYAHVQFPVVELLHGSPGNPQAWLVHLDIIKVIDAMISKHQMGPVVLVFPASNNGNQFQECVNGIHAQDDTYISTDVPNDVMAMFRVSRDRAEWGVAGYSSGGYCSANLSLRHRTDYGAVGIMDGYFRPGDGEASAALGNRPAAEAQNNPLEAARGLNPQNPGPLAAYWVFAGTGNSADYEGAKQFVAAMRQVEAVTFIIEPNADHDFYAWDSSLPSLLSFMWVQLSPPDLRQLFPTRPTATQGGLNQQLVAPPGAIKAPSGSASPGGTGVANGRSGGPSAPFAHVGEHHHTKPSAHPTASGTATDQT